MTISQALTKATKKLQKNKVPTPRLDAEILLSHTLKKPREYILAHPEKQLTKSCVMRYALCVTRRIDEPVAYIIKHKQFYGLDFYVNKNVLIPRPETELMIDEILKKTKSLRKETFRSDLISLFIIDVGTGSGCVIITLAKYLISQYPNIQFLATDISKSALTIARENAKQHNVHKQIKFLHGNLLAPILKNKKLEIRNYNLVILANLPYLTPAQIKNSPSIKYEPKLALNAGHDGLKYYRQLFKQISQCLMVNGQCLILIEIDPSQKIKIKQIIKQELFTRRSLGEGGPNAKIEIKKDLAGLNRLVIITI